MVGNGQGTSSKNMFLMMDIETGDKTERREQKRDQWGMETEKQVKNCEKINAAL